MVKIVILILLTISLNANFKTECVSCHKSIGLSLRKTFMNALLVYGGKKNFKTALFYYCKNPVIFNSVMDEDLVKKFTPLKPITIDDEELKKLLDDYWEKYKVIGNLK